MCAAAVLAVSLTACAPPGGAADAGDAEETLTTFLRALADGELPTAFSLSTAAASDFACTGMIDQEQPAPSIAAPEIRSIAVDGDRASAEVAYRTPAEQVDDVDLERVGGQWRVVIPDSWRLDVGFDAPVVAELTIDDDCRVPVEDAHVQALAWPGNYRVAVSDPTGVLERPEQFLYAVPGGGVTGIDGDATALPAVPEIALSTLGARMAPLLEQAFAACVDAAFAGSTCPAGLTGAAPAPGAQPSTDYLFIERVWTDDARTWRFETRPGSVEVVRDGQTTSAEFRFTGTLGTDSAGALTLGLDAG